MSRTAKGAVEWVPENAKTAGHYKVRITLAADPGCRPWIHLDPGPRSPEAERTARGKAEHFTERARIEGQTREDFNIKPRSAKPAARPPKVGETCDAWYERYFKSRSAQGIGEASADRRRWLKWISPHIGAEPMATVTKTKIEDVRDALDLAVQAHKREGSGEGRLSGKTAKNIWSALAMAFKAAVAAKDRELRARADNPCMGVLPPEDGEARKKTFVYPTEFLALASCKDVPLEWREVHAIACYTYLRPGELRALRWSDVDLEHSVLAVTKAWDGRTKKVKATKTGQGVRQVPIAATLLPLLKRMRKGKHVDALVVPLLATADEDYLAETTRDHLKRAKVTRSWLLEETATTMRAGFRSWRDTGITWLALSGVDVVRMQRRAGHRTITTTMGYVKLAEDLSGTIGQPFPPLPADLESSGESSRPDGSELHPAVIVAKTLCEGGDLNPYGVTR